MTTRDDILKAAQKSLQRTGLQTDRNATSFVEFLLTHIRTDKGVYSFDQHAVLRPIAEHLVQSRETWILKGAQIGLSTLAIGWNLYLPYSRGYNVGYALPTKIFAKRFFKTRFQKASRKSELLRDAVRATEDVGLLGVFDAFLYMLGMENISDAISIPLDAISFDEVDVLNQENMDWADDRIAASEFRQKIYFSVGMNPGIGIDAGYEASNQHVWLVKCPACGKGDQVLEDLFPDCVRVVDDRYRLVCVGCGKPLDVQRTGQWVPVYQGRDIDGYRIPQLIVPKVSLDYIMDRWRKAQGRKSLMAKFRCSTLAKPDAGDRQRITKELLQKMLGDYPTVATSNWSVGGADVGDYCHVAFADFDLSRSRLRFIRFETVDSDRMVEQMSAMITAMGCRQFVIDAKPFRSEVRRLAQLHPDVVVLQYFKDQSFSEGTEEHEGYTYHTVNENREDSLDYYCDLFDENQPGVLLPRFLDNQDFLDTEVASHHIKGAQKVDTEDKRLGKMIPRFRKNVPNHYFMACNNARKAMQLLTTGPAPSIGIVPVFGSPGAA